MALIPIDNVGETGIVKDINPWQLPLMSGLKEIM